MKCILCEKNIEKYDPKFHHLKIDDQHEVDICAECSDTFIKWQAGVIAELFPTKALKKRYGKE